MPTTLRPAQLEIKLPRFSTTEIRHLLLWVDAQLPDSEFKRWLLSHVATEIQRRNGSDSEPSMGVIRITSGVELSKALQAVTKMASISKSSSRIRAFLREITHHVHALVEACLETFDEQISEGLTLRKHNTPVELMCPSECASALGVSVATLSKMVREGSFPRPLTIGSKRLWPEQHVQAYIENRIKESNL